MFKKPIKFLLIVISILCLGKNVRAQDLVVEYDVTDDGGYKFYCQNKTFTNYILSIDFTTITNFRASAPLPFKGTVIPGRNYLFSLTRTRNDINPFFNYTISYHEGCVNPKIKDVIYLLPVSPGKSTEIIELSYLGEKFGIENPRDWYALGFKMESGDTVFAARKGHIVNVESSYDPQFQNTDFSSEENFVKIIHDDCSFSQYRIFQKDGILVKAGELVNAGDPIGIAAGSNYVTGAHVRYMVYYSIEEPVIRNGEITDKINYSAFINPNFWASGETQQLINNQIYDSDHPEKYIFQEMTKGQIKRWLKARKP